MRPRPCAHTARSLLALLLLASIVAGCRRGAAIDPGATAPGDGAAVTTAEGEGGVDATSDAGDSGGDAATATKLRSCADPPSPLDNEGAFFEPIRLDALHAVDRARFSPDQRAPSDRGAYEAPPRVALERVGGDAPARLVLGDAELTRCQILVAQEGVVRGPFAGAAGSDRWSAVVYRGRDLHVVAVHDEAGAIRALRAFAVPSIGSGFTVTRADCFSDGAALAIESYVSADGLSGHALGVYGLARGDLVVQHETRVLVPPGALDVFTMKHEASPTGPTLTITVKAHPAVQDERGTKSKPIDRVRRLRWDARASAFR